jgi:alkyl hydroperoxide reductase subunit D
MPSLSDLKASLAEETKDLRLNLDAVLRADKIDPAQTYAVALASALFIKDKDLAEAILAESAETLTADAISDARAAAAIMAMNTVYYRFRHMIGKESYSQKPAGLRMNRMSRPATNKDLFELCSMACAALAGCEACLKAHETSLLKEGLNEDQVHDCVRIAAVVNGFSVARSASGTVG